MYNTSANYIKIRVLGRDYHYNSMCRGNILSQYTIDNQDGEGSVCNPYYPPKEHFCRPAHGKVCFIDRVNLDGWSMDYLAPRREGFAGGFITNFA